MPDCMSRVYHREEGEYINMDDYSKHESDTEVGTAISTCFIASVEEVYIPWCKEDNMAITWEEIVRAGEKDNEYMAVNQAILQGFPEKLDECIPLIQPFHKN